MDRRVAERRGSQPPRAYSRPDGSRTERQTAHGMGQGRSLRAVEQAPVRRQQQALGIQPLPFTRGEGLQRRMERVDPTSRCVFPGVPRVNNSPYPGGHHPPARQGHPPLRVHAQLPADQHRRPAPPQGDSAFAHGPLRRPVGRRHTGHRHHWAHRPHLARRPRQPTQRRASRDRTVPPRQRRSTALRRHDRRRQVLYEAMEQRLDYAALAGGLGNRRIRVYRLQPGQRWRAPPARSARRLAA